MNTLDLLTTPEELEQHYGEVRQSSKSKTSIRLTPAMQQWLAHSPFFVIGTYSADGIDCSPRGDQPGEAFRILDDRTIAIPDRRGNNRIDSLKNLLHDPRIGVLFLIPHVEVALRVKGTASISAHQPLCDSFSMDDGSIPATVLLIDVQTAYAQNARALRKSALWQSTADEVPADIPDVKQLLRQKID